MPLTDLPAFPRSGTLIGIDPGSKTLGVASTDRSRLIASPVETIARGRRLGTALDRLFEIYDDRRAVGLVIGLPLNMDGSEGPRAQSARALAHHILQRRDVPVFMQDERLSTAEAERVMLEADLTRRRRAELIDASAAAIILKAALDRLSSL